MPWPVPSMQATGRMSEGQSAVESGMVVECSGRKSIRSAEMASKLDTNRAWQRMLSCRRLDLLTRSPRDVDIDAFAHGLARVARWNGQTKGDHAFSVAQHCVLVERVAG